MPERFSFANASHLHGRMRCAVVIAVCLCLALIVYLLRVSGGPDGKPNVLLITLDTTRRDHLSCYGYRKETTPNIDSLAEESVKYERAIAPSSWTVPAHASLFTGMLPTHHNARFGVDENATPSGVHEFSFYTLHPSLPTLAEELGKAGYVTAGIIAGPLLRSAFGFERGFGHYDDGLAQGKNYERNADEVTSLAVRWLERHRLSQNSRPFFLFLNYFDPHSPYFPPEPWGNPDVEEGSCSVHNGLYEDVFRGTRELTSEERETLVEQYDGEISYMDSGIGRLFENMKRLGLYDSTLIVVTSDHGESFGEHGLLEHGRALYEELIRAPLLLKYPGKEKKRGVVNDRVTIVSLMPTILEHVGHPIPETVRFGTLDDTGQALVAEVFRDMAWTTIYGDRFDRDQKAIYRDNYKLIWSSDGRHELYDLSSDPAEQTNLSASLPEIRQHLLSQLNFLIEESGTMSALSPPEIDQELKERLRALGYTQ